MSDDDIIESLEEANGRAIIEERSGVASSLEFRFTHALFRQTLYEEIFAPRRVQWHRLVAATLQDVHAGRLDEHAAELAEHFSQSMDAGDLASAVNFGELAAKRASSVYAYAEAARHLERALQVQQVVGPKDEARVCDLLLELAEALMPAGESERAAHQIAARAFDLAERLGDAERASRACQVALEGMMRYTAGAGLGSPRLVEWSARADRWAPPDGPARVFAEVALGLVRRSELRLSECMDHFSRAIDLARASPDAEPVFFVAGHMLVPLWSPTQLARLLPLTHEVSVRNREGVSAQSLSRALRFGQVIYLANGNRRRAEELWQESRAIASRVGDAFVVILPDLIGAFRATLDGELDTAVERAQAISRRGEELGMAMAGSRWRLSLIAAPLLWTGDRARLSSELDLVDDAMGSAFGAPAVQAWWSGAVGLAASSRATYQAKLVDDAIGTTAGALAAALELAVTSGDREAAKRAASPFETITAVPTSEFGLANVARFLGRAAVLCGEPDAARIHYARALEWTTAIRYRPEVALTRLDLAELLLPSYPSEQAEARKHIEFAIKEFEAMHMQPSLERALKLQQLTASSGVDKTVARFEYLLPAESLTPREQEVATLIARGLSNREIAEALIITEGTAAVHVKHILSKLGFKSRSQLAASAAQRH
jgi:DNA-binding CsgD family transcriptional regulator